MKKFNKALTEATDTFMALQGVQAVAQGKTAVGKDCILVYVTDSTTEVSRSIPKIYKKITVELVQSDTFKTL
jgi:hypothetical protein